MMHEFVDTIPDILAGGVLYVSIKYCTAVHRCACGCGNEVVTPLSPADWKLTFDGETVSLNPSIGNWSLDCQSHYWIANNEIKWSYRFSQQEIRRNRLCDENLRRRHHERSLSVDAEAAGNDAPKRKKIMSWLARWL